MQLSLFKYSRAAARLALHGKQHALEHAVKLIPTCPARFDRETMRHFFVSRKDALNRGSGVLGERRACNRELLRDATACKTRVRSENSPNEWEPGIPPNSV